MTNAATATRTVTVEARIFEAKDYGNGLRVKLYLGQRPSEGFQVFKSAIPVANVQLPTWFQVTITDNVITAISL